jgi:hypothetical protein
MTRAACRASLEAARPPGRGVLRGAAAGAALLLSLALVRPVHAAPLPPPPVVTRVTAAPPAGTAALALGCALLATAAAAALLVARAREPRPRVVVVGAGFAGLQAALELQHWARVTVVDRASYFEYTPGALRAVATGRVASCHRPHSETLRTSTLLRVPPDAQLHVGDRELRIVTPGEALEPLAGVLVRQAAAAQPQLPLLWLTLLPAGAQGAAGTSVPFDFLVLATGSSYPKPIKPDGSEEARAALWLWRFGALAARMAEGNVCSGTHCTLSPMPAAGRRGPRAGRGRRGRAAGGRQARAGHRRRRGGCGARR